MSRRGACRRQTTSSFRLDRYCNRAERDACTVLCDANWCSRRCSRLNRRPKVAYTHLFSIRRSDRGLPANSVCGPTIVHTAVERHGRNCKLKLVSVAQTTGSLLAPANPLFREGRPPSRSTKYAPDTLVPAATSSARRRRPPLGRLDGNESGNNGLFLRDGAVESQRHAYLQ